MFFPPEGKFDIDAGVGDGGGDHLGSKNLPQIPKYHKKKKKFVRQLFTLLGHFSKNLKNYI